MQIKDVTDLDVYKLSLNSLQLTYQLISKLPSAQNNLKNQLTRSAESICPLIAEGFGKKKAPKEFCRFLLMAMGSSDETITHLRIVTLSISTNKHISEHDVLGLIDHYKLVSKKLNKLHTAWQKFT